MKLLYCEWCGDMFALRSNVNRTCECGAVSGKYLSNNHNAITNGHGINVAIANPDLRKMIAQLRTTKDSDDIDYYTAIKKFGNIRCWVRHHKGITNPRSEITEE